MLIDLVSIGKEVFLSLFKVSLSESLKTNEAGTKAQINQQKGSLGKVKREFSLGFFTIINFSSFLQLKISIFKPMKTKNKTENI